MTDSNKSRDDDRLADTDFARVLTRASELDTMRGDRTVAEMRRAAEEAGISTASFDDALAELRTPRPNRRRSTIISAVTSLLIVVGSFVWMRGRAPVVSPGPPMEQQALVLRCLTPGDAAALVRPIMTLKTNTILISPERAPHILNVRGTRKQLEDVRSLLSQHDNSCPTPASAPGK
ncbi:MAG TPA: hypothetical protein VM100_04850 [Longimicrobiales bacterium]|nr:hypothetical protein [Longimicrobiales bacterium]